MEKASTLRELEELRKELGIELPPITTRAPGKKTYLEEKLKEK